MVASASLAIGAAGALAQSSGEHSVAQADAPGAVRCEKAKKLIADAEAADRSEAARSTTVGEVVVVEGSSIEPVREPLTAKIAGEDFAAAGEAILTGTVLKPDASGPVSNARVILRQGDDVVATATADSAGMFRVAARPGIYNILIRQSVLFGTQVFAAKLHAGDQSLGQIKTHFYYVHDDGSPYEGGVTMGVLASIRTYSLASAIRHPWSYLKYLARKL
jgi:hypothetical protein